MPCLLTDSWKPGVSVFEAASCHHNGCAAAAGMRGGTFLPVCNTTSEVCNFKEKEEPQ